MEFDSVLTEIGEFGAWQRRTALLLFPCAMFAGIHNLLFTFTGVMIQGSPKSFWDFVKKNLRQHHFMRDFFFLLF